MEIILKQHVKLTDVPPAVADKLVQKLQLENPKWLENKRMGRWNRGVPRIVKCYRKRGAALWIPRGYMRQLSVKDSTMNG
ncbi:MAG: hypothetical protein R6U50_16060 [Desulfobacterales bacterium]